MELYTPEKEKYLDIKQLLFYFIDNTIGIIIVGLLCGVLLGCFGFYKAQKNVDNNGNNASLQEIMNINRINWGNIDTSVTADAFNNPPAGSCMANAKVYVDINYSSVEGRDNLDFYAINTRFQGDIVTLTGSNEIKQRVIDKLSLNTYDDMKNLSLEDMRMMLNIYFSGVSIMQISVIDVNPERAVAISNAIAEEVVVYLADYESVDSIKIYEPAKLVYNSIQTADSNNGNIKGVAKYGTIGFVAGCFIMLGFLFLVFIFKDTVRTEADLAELGLNIFAIIPHKEKKKETEYKRLKYDISFLEKNALAVLPVDETVQMKDFNEYLLGENKHSCKLVATDGVVENPEAIVKAKECGAVIMAVTFGKTLTKNVIFVKNELKRANVEVVGVVILDALHI